MIDVSRITDQLYVGAKIGHRDVEHVRAFKFDLIISMIAGARIDEVYSRPPFKSLWIRTYDSFLLPILPRKLLRGVAAAAPVLRKGGKVFVYCARGRHRSVAMAAAILISQGHSADAAMDILRQSRAAADPSIWYIRKQIRVFEKTWRRLHPDGQPPEPPELVTVVRTEPVKRVHFIINPASGKRRPVIDMLSESLTDCSFQWDTSRTNKAGDAIELARKAVADGSDVVAACGGDGTVAEVMSALVGTGVPLAIIPAGTGNILAAELNIPASVDEAVALLTCREGLVVRQIDLGRANGTFFAVRLGLGLEAEMIHGADRQAKNRMGLWAYIFSGIRAWRNKQRAIYELTVDGKNYRVAGFSCMIANCGTTGVSEIPIETHVSVSDGLLDVLVVRKVGWAISEWVAGVLSRLPPEYGYDVVAHLQGKHITVKAFPPQAVQYDGETLPPADVDCHVVPRAVDIVVPRPVVT